MDANLPNYHNKLWYTNIQKEWDYALIIFT